LGCIIGIVVALVLVVPILAAISIYGVRRYLSSAKSSEAKNTVSAIARAAQAAYARDRRLCPSASSPVPRSIPSGTKHQSAPGDWEADKGANAGFACLKFEVSSPTYYQYSYTSTGDTFTVVAKGDLDADGTTSEFTIRGTVKGGSVELSSLEVRDELE